MAFSLKGVFLPHKKNTAGTQAKVLVTENTVTLPMLSHIGVPSIPVVKAGDEVKVGTLVARAGEGMSMPIHSSVSGKVVGISDVFTSNGSRVSAITIDSDGEMTADESFAPPVIGSKQELIEAIKSSGVVGLGGAGFPTYIKFSTDKKVDYLILNGTECEPYITSDDYTMVKRADDISYALDIISKYFDIGELVFAIEGNKPEAVEKMKKLASSKSNASVKVLPAKYPGGAEKVVVYACTGRIVGDGKLPIDVGCIVCNITTIAALGQYFRTGMPLVEKCITVDGSAVKEPKLVVTPIGVSIGEVFEFAGGFSSEPGKVIYGGPMMGISVPSLKEPVLKQTNALIAFDEKDSKPAKETACIQCGTCTNNCPLGIDVSEIARAYKKGEYERLEKLGTRLCMECGCCAYGCPAKRSLVQMVKMAKLALREWKAKEANA